MSADASCLCSAAVRLTESVLITPVLVTRKPRPTAGIILAAAATADVITLWGCSLVNSSRFLLPVVVAVAQRSNGDGEGLPRWIQRVLDHLRLVADGEPGRGTGRHEEEGEQKMFYQITDSLIRFFFTPRG